MIQSIAMKCFLVAFVVIYMMGRVDAGPLSYGICQTGCNGLVVSCYAAAGFTFGTVTAGAGVPASIMACNASLGACMAACVAAGCAPTP